jgi:hypothetical protein
MSGSVWANNVDLVSERTATAMASLILREIVNKYILLVRSSSSSATRACKRVSHPLVETEFPLRKSLIMPDLF